MNFPKATLRLVILPAVLLGALVTGYMAISQVQAQTNNDNTPTTMPNENTTNNVTNDELDDSEIPESAPRTGFGTL